MYHFPAFHRCACPAYAASDHPETNESAKQKYLQEGMRELKKDYLDMRDAWPIETGLILSSFCCASILRPWISE